MAGLEDLYREIILDHYRTPRNRGELEPPAVSAEGHNPLCGDEIRIFLDVRDGIVTDVKFSGSGCSISQSSASMMTSAVKGKDVAQVRAIVRKFKNMMTVEEDIETPIDESLTLGDLEALQGVVKFPVRIKCATLGWNTLLDALDAAKPDAESRDDKWCARCGRVITWRSSLAKNWDSVKWCSDGCRKLGLRKIDEQLSIAILDLLAARARDATICPSEAARHVGGTEWEDLMEPARCAARRLVVTGEIVITQGGRIVDPSTAKGPIRLRRA